MTINADTYGSSLLAATGATNLFAAASERYPTVTLDAVVAVHPDLILLPSEPYPFAPRHQAELDGLGAAVLLVDGRDLFWWGIRTPAAIERLRQSIASGG